jgi:hypothetical protein
VKPVYIYGLVDPRTDVVMYIGKTVDIKNRLRQHRKPRADQRMTRVKSWAISLKSKGLEPSMVILEACTEDSWKDREIFHIQDHRSKNDKLLNMADGGNEPLCDDQTRATNARTLTKFCEENKGIVALTRFFALGVRRAKKAGNMMSVEKYSAISEYIVTSSGIERQRFNELGIRKLTP